MKKYYLHNGTEQQGPFDIEDLKSNNITKSTSIWYEGLSEWTTAEKIDELKDLFKASIPPPFKAKTATPPPIHNTPIQETNSTPPPPKKKSKVGRNILVVFILLVLFSGGLFVLKNMNTNNTGNDYGTGGESYQEKVMTVEEIERSQPANFLTADGTYNESFFGDKLKVHGVIKNAATVMSYKDAVVKVTYYSKTKTELGSKEYTIYDNFPPYSEVKFELKIENYEDVNSIGWDVIQATSN